MLSYKYVIYDKTFIFFQHAWTTIPKLPLLVNCNSGIETASVSIVDFLKTILNERYGCKYPYLASCFQLNLGPLLKAGFKENGVVWQLEWIYGKGSVENFN